MNFLSVLTLLFVALKLMNFIDWSWWFVLAPTLIQLAALTTTLVGLFVYAARKK